jgi:hypothetical protein
VYLVDVIIVGQMFPQQLDNFQRFQGSSLKRNPEKCQLFQKEMVLAHNVSPKGMTSDTEKLKDQ